MRSCINGGLFVEAAPVCVVFFAILPVMRLRCSGTSIGRIDRGFVREARVPLLQFRCPFPFLNIALFRVRPGALQRMNFVRYEAFRAVGEVMAI